MDATSLPTDALMWITDRPATVFVRGEGSWLFDAAGRRTLDLIQGWAVNTLGCVFRLNVTGDFGERD